MGRLSCNFFVGFRINEPSIVQGIAELQQRIVERVPDAAPCMLDHRLLHVTLCMIRLPDQDAIDRARDILREQILNMAVPIFSADPPVFEVQGLGFFRSNDLLYAQVDPSYHHAQNMAKVAESLHNAFKAAGFAPASFKLPYTPHVTIWKSTKDNGHISRTDKQHGRRGYLQDAVYNDIVTNEADMMAGHFGSERPVTVELLKSWEKDADGYYRVYDSCVAIRRLLIPPGLPNNSIILQLTSLSTKSDQPNQAPDMAPPNRFRSRQKKPAAPKAPRSERPNFFVGYRINEPSIIQGVAALQQRILERLPDAAPCMVDHRSIHVTLCMIHLPDQDAIDQAMVVLREHMRTVAAPTFSADLPVFEVKGLGFFGSNDILHAQVDTTSSHALHMAHVAESLYNAFKVAGFAPHPFKLPYTPHVTIWKSTKDHGHINRMNKQYGRRGYLQDTLFDDLVQNESEVMTGHFGYERPVTVELLKMLEKEPDGYYRAYGSASLLDTTAPPPPPEVAEATTEAVDESLAKLSLAPEATTATSDHPLSPCP